MEGAKTSGIRIVENISVLAIWGQRLAFTTGCLALPSLLSELHKIIVPRVSWGPCRSQVYGQLRRSARRPQVLAHREIVGAAIPTGHDPRICPPEDTSPFTGTDSRKIFRLPTTSFLKAYGSTIAIDGGRPLRRETYRWTSRNRLSWRYHTARCRRFLSRICAHLHGDRQRTRLATGDSGTI